MNAGSKGGARVLAILLFAYIFNFIDRNVIGVLAVPIRKEFGLSDAALGSLGVAFGIFYALIFLPLLISFVWPLVERRRREPGTPPEVPSAVG